MNIICIISRRLFLTFSMRLISTTAKTELKVPANHRMLLTTWCPFFFATKSFAKVREMIMNIVDIPMAKSIQFGFPLIKP